MGGGSWNGTGNTPAHPSAWCKANQGWVSVVNRTTNGIVTIGDVKTTKKVYRLWKDGAAGKEYFLVENRQRKLYDQKLPGDGLLVYHIDESLDSNENEDHPFVKLLEADAKGHLHDGANRGDAGRSLSGELEERRADGRVQSELEIVRRQRDVCDDHQIGASAANMKVRIGVKGPATSSAKKGKEESEESEEGEGKVARPSALDSSRAYSIE